MHPFSSISTLGGLGILIVLLVGMCNGAGMTVQVGATGETLFGDSQALWTISDGDMTGTPPLYCGQEIVTGSSAERFLLTGPSSYMGSLVLNNAEIINMDVEKSVTSTGPGYYQNSLYFEGVDEGTPEGGCGGEEFASQGATEVTPEGEVSNETTPAEDSYCSRVLVDTTLMGSMMNYKSLGGISAWASDAPDALGMNFSGSVNGIGSVYVGSQSMTSNGGGPGILGYENMVSTRIQAIGKPATIGGNIKWTSFKSTFDTPAGETQET